MEFSDFNKIVSDTKKQIKDDTRTLNRGMNAVLIGSVIGVVAAPIGLSVVGVAAVVLGGLSAFSGSRLKKMSLDVEKDNLNTTIKMYGTDAEKQSSVDLNAKQDLATQAKMKNTKFAFAGAIAFTALSAAFAPIGAVCLIAAASIAIASQFDHNNRSDIEAVRVDREQLAHKVMARRVHAGFNPSLNSAPVAKAAI